MGERRYTSSYVSPDLIDVLCEAGAHFEAHDEDGWTPLHMALFRLNDKYGFPPRERYPGMTAVQRLSSLGADPNAVDCKGRSALHMCIERHVPQQNHPTDRYAPQTLDSARRLCPIAESEVVAHLLSHDADVNAQDADGLSALHRACARRNIDIIATLLASGADVHRPDNDGRTPLFHCLRLRFKASDFSTAYLDRDHVYYFAWPWTVALAIDILLEAGADIHARLHDGDTVLHAAAQRDGRRGSGQNNQSSLDQQSEQSSRQPWIRP